MSCHQMPIETPAWRRAAAWLSLGVLAALSGCALQREPAAPTPPTARTPADGGATGASPTKPADPAKPTGEVRLGPPKPVRSAAELRLQAAQRLVAANPGRVYLGTVPDVLLAIPVLEIELNANGSIKKIDVLRKPGQALDTLDLAIEAVRRAAPFGDVSAMPRPWKFSETFLFNNQRQFKPRTLDV